MTRTRAARLLATGLAVVAAMLFSAPPANAQASGTVSIDIDLPPLVILYYYSDVNVDVPAASLASVMVGGAGDTAFDQATLNASVDASLTFDAGLVAPPLIGDPASVGLTLNRTWAVRSIGSAAGSTEVSVTLDQGNLTNAAASLVINGIQLREGANVGATLLLTPTGLGNAAVGDMLIDLDIRNASFDGTYGGGQYTITARNI